MPPLHLNNRWANAQSPSRKAISAFLLLLLLVFSCPGCSHPPEERGVTIQWFTDVSPELLKLYTQQLIPAFERGHPGIHINLNASLGDLGFEAKLMTLVAGGMAPDVAHVNNQNFPMLASKSVLLDVTPLARSDRKYQSTDYFDPVLKAMQNKGQLLGLPSDFSTILIFYNRQLFGKARVAPPSENWRREGFLEAAKRLTIKDNGDTKQWGFFNIPSINRWPAWVWMEGGDVFNADVSQSLLDSEPSVRGLQYYVDLGPRYGYSPLSGDPFGKSVIGQDFQQLFMQGRVAMIADSRYAYKKYLGKLPFDWDVAALPKGKTRATTFIWGGNCILKSTKHPREAWEWLKFLSGREGALINAAAGNGFPAYRPVALDARQMAARGAPVHDHLFIDALGYARSVPFPDDLPAYRQALDQLGDAFLGLVSTRQACQQFTRTMNPILHRGQKS